MIFALKILLQDAAGLMAWGFSRLQNKNAKFLKAAKIFSLLAKIFEAYLKNFSKSFRYEMFCEKMSSDIEGKNSKAAKRR